MEIIDFTMFHTDNYTWISNANLKGWLRTVSCFNDFKSREYWGNRNWNFFL
jgi:hypothetical protein